MSYVDLYDGSNNTINTKHDNFNVMGIDEPSERKKECDLVYLCPKCNRVYQVCKETIWDKVALKSKLNIYQEYLEDFPKLGKEKINCKECK